MEMIVKVEMEVEVEVEVVEMWCGGLCGEDCEVGVCEGVGECGGCEVCEE